ncbi:hypothetical protein D3C87_1124150 [compost metagenome]
MLVGLLAVHWLHVVAAIIWVGAQIYSALVLWPTLLRRPAGEARGLYEAMAVPAMRLMGPAGMVLLITGILRGTWLGPVRSFEFLIATPYGLTFLTSIGLVVLLMAIGGGPPARLHERIWDGGVVREGAAAYLTRKSALSLALLGGILVCMVLMRFGL